MLNEVLGWRVRSRSKQDKDIISVELTSSICGLARTIGARHAFRAVLVAGLFSFSTSAWAQISMVRVTSCGPQTFPASVCAIPATGSGNLLVIAWNSYNGNGATTIANVTDNAGNSYSAAGNARAVDTAPNTMVDIWYAKNSRPGATAVTVSPSPTGTGGTAVIWEFSGVDTTLPLDQSAVLNSQVATTTPSGASVTTTSAVQVVISVANLQGAPSGVLAGNPFTSDSTVNGNGWTHLITSSSGTYGAQWSTSSGTYAASTVSFKAAGGGSPSNACDLATPYGIVDSADVNSAVSMVLNPPACTANIIGPGVCNVVVVQRVINAMGGACVTGTTAVSSLSCVPGSVTAPGSSTCTVGLSAAAPAGGASVSLSSDNANVTVPASITVPANASSTNFTANVASVATNQTAILTAAAAGTNRTFSLGVVVPTVSHSVALTWTASTSSGVTGYNVYRSTTSGGPYTKITPSPVSTLTYTDNAVQSGLTYYYVATAMDVNGNESVFSAQAPPALIP